MKEAALGRKARRYATGVAKVLCGSRKTIPAAAVEDLLMSAYYNGHQSGEVHAQVEACHSPRK